MKIIVTFLHTYSYKIEYEYERLSLYYAKIVIPAALKRAYTYKYLISIIVCTQMSKYNLILCVNG